MNNNVAMIQQNITREMFENVPNVEQFLDYTKDDMARHMYTSVRQKMEFTMEDAGFGCTAILGKVIIMSPQEYRMHMREKQQLEEQITHLKEQLLKLAYGSY
ncbi:hypothetical protein [Priestia megaterium]